MAAFETLLGRFRERPGMGLETRSLEAFQEQAGPPHRKAWRAWAEAERALHLSAPRLALGWLAAAQDASPDPSDIPLRAELASAETRGWLLLDEPRDALGPARVAWQGWLALARDPQTDLIVPSVRELLSVLSEPHAPPELADEEVLHAWLLDRFTRQFDSAPRTLLGVYADLGHLSGARTVAREYLGWVDGNVAPTFGRLSEALVAGFLLALGNVYDRCGDPAKALDAFQDGLKRLEGAPELAEIDAKRAQLHFNSANQLGAMGRHREALGSFQEVERAMSEMESPGEALLRARFGVVISEFHVGQREGLVERLIDLATEYERTVADAPSGPADLAARQGRDRVYRLWLRLSAEDLDLEDPRETLLFFNQLFALKEEEGKLTRLWRAARERPDAALHGEVSVLMDRLDQRGDATLLVVEQAAGALIVASLGPGGGHWSSRITVQVLGRDDAGTLADLIRAQRTVVDRMAAGEARVDAEPDTEFVDSCRRAWDVLDPGVREAIDAAATVLVTLDNQTQLDELPVELLHDGTTYLGLRTDVVRAVSLNDLNTLLGENRTNAASPRSAVIVRSDDDLSEGEAEVRAVTEHLARMELEVTVQAAPDSRELLARLGSGADLLHYVGHGLADEVGEELPLGSGKRLRAREVLALGPAPAPVAILSACLAGRARQLRTGRQGGFVPALAARGAPAVVAAKYVVGSGFAVEYVSLLYFFLERQALRTAVRSTRLALSDEGYHPAAWSLFVLYGGHDAKLRNPHATEARTWPPAVVRYLATGSESYLASARSLLEGDARLSAESRAAVDRDLVALAGGDAAYFHPAIASESRGLSAFSEAMMVSNLVRVFGLIRHGTDADPTEREGRLAGLIAHALEMEGILADTYLLVAAAVEMKSRTMMHLYGEGKNTLRRARRGLRWLSADAEALGTAKSILQPKEE